jgi:biopolymer transport protein ExbD
MKFPRNAKILRSHFDVAPFAAVFFLLLIFMMVGAMIPTAGIPLHTVQPPEAADLPGPDTPSVSMAVDANSNLYFENQIVSERVLMADLRVKTNEVHAPLTLVVHADKTVSYDMVVHLSLLARKYGITHIWLATLPGVDDPPAKK